MNTSDKDFVSWGTKAGIPADVLQSLIKFACTPEELQTSIDKMLPAPPIFPIGEIRMLHEKDLMGIKPGKASFLVIGNCPNGDPIAADIGQEPGSVWYISHEQMFGTDLRSVAVKVANSIPAFYQALAEDESFPLGYWDAA